MPDVMLLRTPLDRAVMRLRASGPARTENSDDLCGDRVGDGGAFTPEDWAALGGLIGSGRPADVECVFPEVRITVGWGTGALVKNVCGVPASIPAPSTALFGLWSNDRNMATLLPANAHSALLISAYRVVIPERSYPAGVPTLSWSGFAEDLYIEHIPQGGARKYTYRAQPGAVPDVSTQSMIWTETAPSDTLLQGKIAQLTAPHVLPAPLLVDLNNDQLNVNVPAWVTDGDFWIDFTALAFSYDRFPKAFAALQTNLALRQYMAAALRRRVPLGA